MDLSTIGVKFDGLLRRQLEPSQRHLLGSSDAARLPVSMSPKIRSMYPVLRIRSNSTLLVLVTLVETGILTSTGRQILLRLGMHY